MDGPALSERPIRVVFFGGGPRLEEGARHFLVRLENHPDIALVGAYCQSEGQSLRCVFGDLWRRRKLLAFPLLATQLGSRVASWLRDPRGERRLRARLASLEDRLHYVPDIHRPDVLEQVRGLGPDLGLVYGAPILRPELFEIPSEGTLGIHHGTLPQYRGKKTTFWEMYHAEPTAGVTIQRINRGLDTGEVVKQGAVEIGARTRSAVWRDIERLGLDLYLQAILEVREGTATFRAQEGPKGRLYRDPPLRLVVTLRWRQLLKSLRSGRGDDTTARDAAG